MTVIVPPAVLEYDPPSFDFPLYARTAVGTVPVAVPCARRFVYCTLINWGMHSLADDAATVTSELVTNACQASWPWNASDPIRIAVSADGLMVLIEVWDPAPEMPELRTPDADAEGGRGLVLVASLAQSWGIYTGITGKTVWALV